MKTGIFSLYWENIDERIPYYQQKVMEKMQMHVSQQKINGLPHGEWMQWVMERHHYDAILFMDIDCVISNRDLAINYIGMAVNGELVGNVQATNHLGPEVASKDFAAASFIAVNKKMWVQLGKPHFDATPYGDVAQLLTDTWRQFKVPVNLIPVTHFEVPKWDLPGKPQSYGIGTTFGDCNYHLFESRNNDNIERFVKKCESILA
jgi:hypothetical protein